MLDTWTTFAAFRPAVFTYLIFILLGIRGPLALQAEDQTIRQMVHTAWTGRDGAPQGITALAQTPDGILWIGSVGGLYTFDGITFRQFRPGNNAVHINAVRSLLVAHDGSLWVSSPHGPPIRIKNGVASLYDRVEEPSIRALDKLQEDNGAIVGVLNGMRLVRLGKDLAWHNMKLPFGDEGLISNLFADSRGSLWMIQSCRLYLRTATSSSFSQTDITACPLNALREAPDQSIWLLGTVPSRHNPNGNWRVGIVHIDANGHLLSTTFLSNHSQDLLVDRSGAIWLSDNRMLWRMRTLQGNTSGTAQNDLDDSFELGSLTINGRPMLLDQDGTLWVGSLKGLDRFRKSKLVPLLPNSSVGNWFACADSEAVVWADDNDHPLLSVQNGNAIPVLGIRGVSGLFCGKQSGVWFIDDSGVGHIADGRVLRLPILPGEGHYAENSRFIGLLPTNAELYASVGGLTSRGVWTYAQGEWKRFFTADSESEVWSMLQDESGSLYFGTEAGDLIKARPDGAHAYLSKRSSLGGISGLVSTSYGIFAIGLNGITLWNNDRPEPLLFSNPDDASKVFGLVQSRDGDIWLNGLRGIVRISAAEMRHAVEDPRHQINGREIREGDFVGPDISILFRQSAFLGPKDVPYFVTLNGIVTLNPEDALANQATPRLAIRSITSNARPIGDDHRFPPGTQAVVISYFGVNLANPRDVIYRYFLSGLDKQWHAAGRNTEASYSNLRPGTYAFKVMASNGDGYWSPILSTEEFRILPRFYQTWWFYAALLFGMFLLLYTGIRFRIRSATRVVQLRASERADERIKIARDLHDTLLQGVQGLMLSVHAAASKIPRSEEARSMLDRALERADSLVLEGRDRVSDLRSEPLRELGCGDALRILAQDLGQDSQTEFSVQVSGHKRSLDEHVEDELYKIGREALINAFRHASATRIVLQMKYGRQMFTMSCKDDGLGMSGNIKLTTDHFGLLGIEERAKSMGGRFQYSSEPGLGTTLVVQIPARFAYKGSWFRKLLLLNN